MSNAEKMVMVPRELLERIEASLNRHMAGHAPMRIPVDQTDSDLVREEVRMVLAKPAQQHQVEPVALPARKNPSAYPLPMDAARGYGWNACLDEIAKLGPLYAHPAPVRGEPVAWCQPHWSGKYADYCWGPERPNSPCPELWKPLYTHTDPAEVERLRERMLACEEIAENNAKACAEALTKLAEAHALLREVLVGLWPSTPLAIKVNAALSASAEPSASVEIDERAEFEKWYLAEYYEEDAQCGLEWLSTEPCGGYHYSEPARHWKVWQARAALERKP